jgi:molybdenum cofactor cytidylyltransferase
MRFGRMPVADAEGAVLAHSVRFAGGAFKKGRRLSADDISTLRRAEIANVFAARLDPGDIAEDEAASLIAQAIAGENAAVEAAFTGRANLHATAHGIVVIDTERVRTLNRVHESVTLAVVNPFDTVEPRQLIATVKIIPFAVPGEIVARVLAAAGSDPMIRVAGFRHRRVGLAISRLPQMKPSLIAKSVEAVRERVAALGSEIAETTVVAHAIEDVSAAIGRLREAGCNPILVFGASAIVDRGDVIPAAVVEAGGEVVHLGMPVDPGNLLMFGRLHGTPVIGVPSCARSPKLNGFDWVLRRVLAGVHVSGEDIMDMGAGGLLKEIPSRPSPRESGLAKKAPRVAAIVLAAGRSSRMGGRNKLLIEVGGRPMVRRVVEAVAAAGPKPLIVVTGHQEAAIRGTLAGTEAQIVHNPHHASGLSTSLRAGLAALPAETDAALIALGDMPFVSPGDIRRLIAAFAPQDGRSICVPVFGGRRGNPVLWGRKHFTAMTALEGDEGARSLLPRFADEVAEVNVSSENVLKDFDTPESLAGLEPVA